MKKVAYFFSGFLPIFAAIGIETIAMFFMIGIGGLFLFPAIPAFRRSGSGRSDLFDLLSNSDFNACIMVLYAIICIVIFGLIYYRYLGGTYLPNTSRTFHPMQLLGIVVLVPGTQFFCSYLIAFVSAIFPNWLKQYEELLDQAGVNSDIGILMLCYSVILAPLCEELIFRGVTMRLFRQAMPFWLANLFQAILFGIFHMNWIQGIYAFAFGLLLGFVCEKGGSIYYSILFHVLFNLWGTVISQLFESVEDTMLVAVLTLLATAVSLAVGMLLFVFGMKRKEAKIRTVNTAASNVYTY